MTILSFGGEESLFRADIIRSPMVEMAFLYLDENREKIIEEWIELTEIPAPSGHEIHPSSYLFTPVESQGIRSALRSSPATLYLPLKRH